MALAISEDERRVNRRLSAIEQRITELTEMWDYACSTDAQYRMVEAEKQALRQERETLKEIKGDL